MRNGLASDQSHGQRFIVGVNVTTRLKFDILLPLKRFVTSASKLPFRKKETSTQLTTLLRLYDNPRNPHFFIAYPSAFSNLLMCNLTADVSAGIDTRFV